MNKATLQLRRLNHMSLNPRSLLLSRVHFPWAVFLSLFVALRVVGADEKIQPRSESAPSPEGVAFFESKIRPVLARECFECHTDKKKGGLRLDYRGGWLQGGDSGPAIVPGDPGRSLIIQALTHRHPKLKMPKDGEKLDERIIKDFIAWVSMGAPDPREQAAAGMESQPARGWPETFAERKQWWSFQPVKTFAPPPATNPASAHPVDRFISAKLRERGLPSAEPAAKRVLLRRLTFALTGLPPSPQALQDFEKNASSEAYEQEVDQLLASPHFGERWARHWMDLVRFAESHGSEGDPEIPEAWRYRDYLIRAFNGDVPIDQLIREHIAGDLLSEPRWNTAEGLNESILGIAQFRFVEHGFQPVDTLDDQVRVIENQIDVLGKAFQGLTIACARCHDHKFDPISQRDFYALYGVLASCRPSQVTIDAPARLRAHRKELAELKQEIKHALAATWRAAAKDIPAQLLATSKATTALHSRATDDAMHEEIAALEQQRTAIEERARQRILKDKTTNAGAVPRPLAVWTFEDDARDQLGAMHGELLGGAIVKKGRLILDGKRAFVRTAPLSENISEKTLEVWVALARLDQQGGGVFTLETADGSTFDSVVFAEQEAGRWMAGSDFFRRSKSVGGSPETARPGELVHMAFVYGSNNSIAVYRNAAPYGDFYTPSGDKAALQKFHAGRSHILFGLRHTEAANGFLAGEIEEARLYNRALTPEEIAQSFNAGVTRVSQEGLTQALTSSELTERSRLGEQLERLRSEFQRLFPDYNIRKAAHARMVAAVTNAANPGHPLGLWKAMQEKAASDFSAAWRAEAARVETETAARAKWNEQFKPAWDFTAGYETNWFATGINPPEFTAFPGDFCVEPDGDRVLSGLYPAGIYSHRLSQKHNGVFMSPRFKVENDSISIRGLGGKGARVRLIVDNYPLGSEGIFPQADLKNDAPGWLRLDVAYRKGSQAYLEFAPAEEVLARNRPPPGAGGRSYYGVESVVFHDAKEPPREQLAAVSLLLDGSPADSAETLAAKYGAALAGAIQSWETDTLTEPQRAFLDYFLRAELLPNSTNASSQLARLVAAYRTLESSLPAARRSPGLIETRAYQTPLFARGDPNKPREPVPRRYLELFASQPYSTQSSGRLELAEEMASPRNPLTSRVIVNRIWKQLFGQGIVATVDNFGRLGDKPTHPELLDFLAGWFVEHGWSSKALIRFLVTSETFQQSSEPPSQARDLDPANQLLSHMPVRRLEAEVIRDSLLAVSGRLDRAPFGRGVNALAAPSEQTRRSIYFMIRRNTLSPFLEVFDAPKPFTTIGRRETTNVPAQSLALLNDPFVIEMARQWAKQLIVSDGTVESRVREMFETALGRLPTDAERASSGVWLLTLVSEHNAEENILRNEAVWRDFAQALFNFKEFIYVR